MIRPNGLDRLRLAQERDVVVVCFTGVEVEFHAPLRCAYGIAAFASSLNQVREEAVVLTAAIEVQIEVSLLHLFLRYPDIVQCLSYRAVTEDLLEQQESPGVMVADQHLVVSEGLAQSVGGYHDVKTERIGDLL